MNANQAKYPQLRFKGFTDPWEERKLENIAQINKGIQRGKQEISSVRNELNPYPVYNGGKKASGYTDECNRENSVMVSEGGASAGYVNYYSGKYWSGGHNFTISNDTKHDTFFLLYVLQKSQEKLYKLQVGTGLPNIQLKSIKDFPIYSTSNTEQQKIGSFFKELDDTIALHQRKLDLLKEQKKGYLQKMFPKNGAKVPELRFLGFADDWEERKLSEGTSKIGDGLHGTPNYSENGDVFFINGNNLVNGKILISKETKLVTESDQSKDDKLLSTDTILMSINGTIGNLAWYNNERVMLGKSAAYLIVSDFDKKFIFSYLQTSTIKNYFLNNLTGTTIKNLGLKTIRDTTLFVPILEEQQKIGSFFKQLDDTIALHQRKLEKLQELKKGYLQKMFC
ncbi:restriction endonuclease subunit S [Lacticaseibacillus paracasei]|jgi:type I restriction enzyme S subunit|uniref:restriction endonuclease subunit S n=2 Tax=Lacticaseibacillus paracasei TaxID=1597 RepID=UPI00029741A9|nr:type I restriction-modification system, specificity subunit S [Lacticaseibacillus paracasei]NMN63605.1 type I restriction enzyme S subunit [Lacticaseibacillus casei]NMN66791.1 type I restriction enzyme S subunit [Lacticaseibacillus casei CRF28]